MAADPRLAAYYSGREPESLLEDSARQSLLGAVTGKSPSAAQAQLGAQLQQARQQQARLAGGSPAQLYQGMVGSTGQVVTGALPLASRALADQYGALGSAGETYRAMQEGEIQRRRQAAQLRAAQMQADAQRDAAGRGILGNILGGLMTGGAAAVLSDARAKRGLARAPEEADAFLESLTPRRFAYRGEQPGEPAHLGVVAQEMEHGPGAVAIERDAEGMRRIDSESVLPLILASLARLDERIGASERWRGG